MTKTYKLTVQSDSPRLRHTIVVSEEEIKRLIKENPELLEEKVYKPWRAEEDNDMQIC